MKKDKRRKLFSSAIISSAIIIFCLIYLTQKPPENFTAQTTSMVSTSTISTSTTSTIPTSFIIISPKNMDYSNGRITVSIRANDVVNWIGESVDNGAVVKECYDCVSFERYDMSFPAGKHTLTAYVEDKNGRQETATVVFTVLAPTVLK